MRKLGVWTVILPLVAVIAAGVEGTTDEDGVKNAALDTVSKACAYYKGKKDSVLSNGTEQRDLFRFTKESKRYDDFTVDECKDSYAAFCSPLPPAHLRDKDNKIPLHTMCTQWELAALKLHRGTLPKPATNVCRDFLRSFWKGISKIVSINQNPIQNKTVSTKEFDKKMIEVAKKFADATAVKCKS